MDPVPLILATHKSTELARSGLVGAPVVAESRRRRPRSTSSSFIAQPAATLLRRMATRIDGRQAVVTR